MHYITVGSGQLVLCSEVSLCTLTCGSELTENTDVVTSGLPTFNLTLLDGCCKSWFASPQFLPVISWPWSSNSMSPAWILRGGREEVEGWREWREGVGRWREWREWREGGSGGGVEGVEGGRGWKEWREGGGGRSGGREGVEGGGG